MLALIAWAALAAADAPSVPPPPPSPPPVAAGAADDATAQIRSEYQTRRQAAGRTPDDQVRLAYWCEAHGLSAERLRHLALAVLTDPDHAAARGLMGLVSRDQRWLKPEAVADRVNADPAQAATLAEYDTRRSTTPYTADGQWNLGLWADEQGLTEQARAHFTAVVRLDPRRDVAWKRLGYRKVDGRWTTDAEIATARADSDAQKAADKRWKSLLERSKAQLARPAQRAEAEANLLSVTDPRALNQVLRVFLSSREADQLVAVRLLGQIDSPGASRTLAGLAISAASGEVRRQSTETLRHRDPREFADLLINRLRSKIRYQVRPVGGPGSPGSLFVEGKEFNKQRVYAPPAMAYLPRPYDYLTFDANGLPVANRTVASGYLETDRITGAALLDGMRTGTTQNALRDNGFLPPLTADMAPGLDPATREAFNGAVVRVNQGDLSLTGQLRQAIHDVGKAEHKDPSQFGFKIGSQFTTTAQLPIGQMMMEAQKTAALAQQQLQRDVQSIDAVNNQIEASNDRVQQVLVSATGVNFGDDAPAWQAWWINQIGYRAPTQSTTQTPTVVENVPLDYQPAPIGPTLSSIGVATQFTRCSCFGAGTLVQAVTGPRAIESLAVGDLVLTQSVATGALGYHPVLVTHHNPPAPTFRVQIGADTIVASEFHRFWVARRGWVMARDLKAGDPVRTLAGVQSIDSVEGGKVEPVFNLDVADDADFFAGASAALVHDNTLPDPRLIPFDRPSDDVKTTAAPR